MLGFTIAAREYFSPQFPENGTIDDFFKEFSEGNKHFEGLESNNSDGRFFVQTRVQTKLAWCGGRIGMSYTFKSANIDGELRVSWLDNGERVSDELSNEICEKFRSYAMSKKLVFREETYKEF
jgi:hypothetical protein